MPILSCSVPNCERRHSAKGLCNMHYQRLLKHGDVQACRAPKHPERTPGKCAVDSCGQEVSARGWCIRHYQRWRRAGDVEDRKVLVSCVECGSGLPPGVQGGRAVQKFCSAGCRRAVAYRKYLGSGKYEADLAAQREANASKPLNQVTCVQCELTFESKHRTPKFCSTTCNNQWRDEHNEARCAEVDCERGVRAKGLCNMHWRRKARAEGRERGTEWGDRRKANYQQRRALKLKLPADNIRPVDVYERDEWVCGICSTPVDRALAYPDPMSPSLDHVLPLSLGGHHTMENVTLAHLLCNVRKGNRVEADVELSV